MANPQRGELQVTAGDGTAYTLKLTTNALAAVEGLLTMPGAPPVKAIDVLREAKAGSLRAIRAVTWGMLRAHHPATTVEQAGDLLDDEAFATSVIAAVAAAMPDPEDRAELAQRPSQAQPMTTGPSRPRTRGTGARSKSTRAVSG